MRKYLFLLLLLPFALQGCSDDEEEDAIWDFATNGVRFIVEDKAGKDLLCPESAENILDRNIVVTYKGKDYQRIDDERNKPGLRYNMPRDLALRYGKYEKSPFFLEFGEFTPCDDHKGETFTIDWGNGVKDTVTFDFYITWKKKKPTVHTQLYLNGKEIDGWQIKKVE